MATHKNLLKLIVWNATSVGNKIIEHKFLMDNTDIAIITETWLTPTDVLKLPNYNIHRKYRSPTRSNNPRGGTLIAIRKDIPQSLSSNTEYLSIKLKTTPTLIIDTAYVSSKTKILHTDLDYIIPSPRTEHFLIGEHCI